MAKRRVHFRFYGVILEITCAKSKAFRRRYRTIARPIDEKLHHDDNNNQLIIS